MYVPEDLSRLAQNWSMLMSNFTRVLNTINSAPHKYWRVGTKLGGVDSRWEMMKENNCVAVGWDKIRDLSDIGYNREDKEKLRTEIAEKYQDRPQQAGRSTQQLFNFVAAIQEGDLVIPSDGQRILGIGRINGAYFYEPASDAPHRRLVQWLSLEEWQMPEKEGLRTTIHEIKGATNLVGIEKKLFDTKSPPAISKIGPSHKRCQALRYLGSHPIGSRAQETSNHLRAARNRKNLLGGKSGTGFSQLLPFS
jgi:5-methylcytosine-specific restriction enzyme B